MPTPQFTPPMGGSSLPQVQDYIVKLIRDLNFMLGNLDTLNVNRLDAKVLVAQTITADKILAGSITATQISAGTITADKIATNTITATQIAANTITASQIASKTITASQIATDTITANEIATNAITATEIAAGAVTATKISVSQLSAITADLGTVSAGSITSNTTVNIGTNATIGKKLILSQSDFLNGIYWGSSSMQIYIDPAANAVHIEASGGVYANTKRIDI